jgi:hypothetical protein
MAAFALGGVIAVAVAGFVWSRRRRTSPWGAALVAAAVPVCVYVTLALALTSAEIKPSREQDPFDTARLTPSVALAMGHDVYSTRTEGAVQTTMYPPMWVVSYLPVAVMDTPSGVLRVGIALTLLFAVLPAVLLFVKGSSSIGLGLLGSTSFFLVATSMSSLAYSLFKPHADAPGLGFAMLACALILRGGEPTARRLLGVGVLAWLSVLSKQVMFPILLALPLWFLLVHGRRACARLVGWMCAAGAGLMALLTLFFRPEGVVFNCLIIPARAPWELEQYPRVVATVLAGAELAVHSIPLVLLLTAGAVLSVAVEPPARPSATGLRPFLAGHGWALPALVALTMIPVSIAGRVKVGGYVNTFSPTTYFLLAAGILAAIGIPEGLKDKGDPSGLQFSLGLLALCSLVLAGGGGARIPFLATDFPPSEHPTQRAYDFLTREDPDAFFPSHPLAHLLADGSLFHFGPALYDREELARMPLPSRQRQSHFPAAPSRVCWDRGEEWMRGRYFTEYTRRIEVRSLESAWECYARQPPGLTTLIEKGRFEVVTVSRPE